MVQSSAFQVTPTLDAPVDDALVDALVGAEAAVMIETDSAAAAIAAQTTRCDIHFTLGTLLREVST
jgi:hypothetical protein